MDLRRPRSRANLVDSLYLFVGKGLPRRGAKCLKSHADHWPSGWNGPCCVICSRLMIPVTKRLSFRFAVSCGLFLCGLSIGCNSNFIPIPPPGNPSFEPVQVADAIGAPRQVWQVSGVANEAMKGARVSVFNLTLGLGVIVKATAAGSYASGLLEGAPGDKVELFYDSASSEKSPTICRKLQPGIATTPCE